MILTSIAIGFTDQSLSRSSYARCAKLLRQVAVVYSPPKHGQPDDLAEYRRLDERIDLDRLKNQEPALYERTVAAGRLLPFDKELYWSDRTKAELNDHDLVSQLEPYAERQINPWVELEKLPKDLRKKVVARAKRDDRLSAWYTLPYEEGLEKYCKGCPIRPQGERDCHLHFSSYPAMDMFREGFLITLMYAGTIDKEKVSNALFSFPHMDRKRDQVPKDKIAELFAMFEGVEVDKSPEQFFNSVTGLLQAALPTGSTMDTQQLSLQDAPLVDQFISALLYRDKPYSPDEAGLYLPYIETLKEVADWAVWDTDNARLRHSLLSFRDRMQTMATAMEFAEKYGLEMYVSY